MNKVLVTVAAAVSVKCASVAYSFDQSRFYGDATIEATTSNIKALQYTDGFELDPSGKITKTIGSALVNTNGVFNSSNGNGHAQPSAQLAIRVRTTDTNTSYSFPAAERHVAAACGLSPLTAFEIEKLVDVSAQAHGVDPGLAKAIAWTESRFDQNRTSAKGARGAMQLMPDTAKELGVRDICDAASNIDGGIRHLKNLVDEFQNPILAAAAYNAGAQAVFEAGGVPAFGETVRYVASVTNYQIGLQLPRRPSSDGAITHRPSPTEQVSDVIGAQGGRFVKGVMQFKTQRRAKCLSPRPLDRRVC
ncbi:lytic transglycosylase domain-containing protein [Rhizobium tubonense]|uniref:lytic transglycosylase domain-containing protein n=1 Tax=Rhizobium tubonense TaxID=484088 RepID=UPI001FCE7DE4|nr:lytic transglycosylase domain-containing protein [Rhizobium tubonense]